MKYWYCLILLLILGEGCVRKGELELLLGEIETMRKDSAMVLLNQIDEESITDDYCRAYYYMLKTKLYYQNHIPFDYQEINYSIFFFKGIDDRHKLALSYYYKGHTFVHNNNDSAIVCYKYAEYYSEKIDDTRLKYNICWAIASLNNMVGDSRIGLEYAKKRYELSKDLAERDQINSLLNMAILYHELCEDDSARLCCSKIFTSSEQFSSSQKPYYYNLLGELSLDTDRDKALAYFEEGAKYKYLPQCFQNLAKVYYLVGREAEADIMVKRTMDSCCYEIQIDLLRTLCDMEAERGNYQKALLYSLRMNECKDSLQQRIADTRLGEEQQRIQEEVREQERRVKADRCLLVAIVMIGIVMILVLLFMYFRLSRLKRISDRELIDSRKKAFSPEVQKLLDWVSDNKSIVKWTSDDIDTLVNGYLAGNTGFAQTLYSKYTGLTSTDRFFLILEYLGKSDSDIAKIMAVTKKAVSVRRSRLRTK